MSDGGVLLQALAGKLKRRPAQNTFPSMSHEARHARRATRLLAVQQGWSWTCVTAPPLSRTLRGPHIEAAGIQFTVVKRGMHEWGVARAVTHRRAILGTGNIPMWITNHRLLRWGIRTTIIGYVVTVSWRRRHGEAGQEPSEEGRAHGHMRALSVMSPCSGATHL